MDAPNGGVLSFDEIYRIERRYKPEQMMAPRRIRNVDEHCRGRTHQNGPGHTNDRLHNCRVAPRQ